MKPGKEKSVVDEKTRILIVDDHPLVRRGLAALMENQPDLAVCAEAGDMGEALRQFDLTHPTLAIVDISLAGGNGLELIKRLVVRDSHAKILVVSMHEETLFAERALQAGAMGYINKQEATTRIIEAIRQVLRGKVYLSEPMTERLLKGVAQGVPETSDSSIASLSDRELEVFGMIGQGIGTSQIAEQLHLSVKTIETHRDRIKKKLNLESGSELNRRAMQWVMEQG